MHDRCEQMYTWIPRAIVTATISVTPNTYDTAYVSANTGYPIHDSVRIRPAQVRRRHSPCRPRDLRLSSWNNADVNAIINCAKLTSYVTPISVLNMNEYAEAKPIIAYTTRMSSAPPGVSNGLCGGMVITRRSRRTFS